MLSFLPALALLAQAPAEAPAPTPIAPAARQITRDIFLLPGQTLPGRGPDGNTIVLVTRRGLIVVDTGRHVWHSDGILSFAREHHRPISAIVNTHWHLDHSSGNSRLKAAFPNARLYATPAIDGALTGFLRRSLEATQERLAGDEMTPLQREEAGYFVATMAASDSLRPDVAVSQSARMTIAGRRLDVHVTSAAVTDADIWIYDRRSRVLVLGDLVTLPAPYLDTACPEAWRATLDEVWAQPFITAIPGHGEPMSRADFATYRAAYGAYIDCARGELESSQCAAGWVRDASALLGPDENYRDRALRVSESYVRYLRANNGKSPDCLTR